jgi:hypothetical protein
MSTGPRRAPHFSVAYSQLPWGGEVLIAIAVAIAIVAISAEHKQYQRGQNLSLHGQLSYCQLDHHAIYR